MWNFTLQSQFWSHLPSQTKCSEVNQSWFKLRKLKRIELQPLKEQESQKSRSFLPSEIHLHPSISTKIESITTGSILVVWLDPSPRYLSRIFEAFSPLLVKLTPLNFQKMPTQTKTRGTRSSNSNTIRMQRWPLTVWMDLRRCRDKNWKLTF